MVCGAGRIQANSLWAAGFARRSGGCGGTGGAVNPSLGALTKHPCLVKPPYPRTRRPSDGVSVATVDQEPHTAIETLPFADLGFSNPHKQKRRAGPGVFVCDRWV